MFIPAEFPNPTLFARPERSVPAMRWMALSVGMGMPFLAAADPSPSAKPLDNPAPALTATSDNHEEARFSIQEYRIEGGGHLLTREETETAVYPYLGPYRTAGDVEGARGALEAAYREKGYQTVTVSIPAQHARTGVIVLEVSRGQVNRLNVIGSRYFSIDEIKREAPSLQEGASPNFTQVTHDLVVLNQLSDRRVTPTVRAGEIPGTVDVDLNVKDTLPLHGSLELNNRSSADTSSLRVNGAINYDNLWQLGHSIGFSFQVAPRAPSEVQVYSGDYVARVPGVDWLTLMLQGTDQNSDVNTLGGIGVVGRGQVIGGRAVFTLPQLSGFYHSLSVGVDFKHFEQDLMIAGVPSTTPVTYYPFSAAYSGTWIGKGYETDLNASVDLGLRGLGSSEEEFDRNRFGADGSFIYFRGDLSHTRELPEGFQGFVKVQGQASDKPLVSSEQFSAGGLGTVRGYLESEDLGDNGLIGNFELRTPSLGSFFGKAVDDWRFYAFGDAGILTIDDALPQQQESFKLASVGGGTRVKLQDHYNGSFDLGLPLVTSVDTKAYEPRITFRVWAEF